MRPQDVRRFFEVRVTGPGSFALAIHLRDGNRLIGTCAFSQLDGDNGSALFHITIGETDCWGQGYGTEATGLMLEHAFRTLRLHRVALAVFAFNERAIRSYRKVGFVTEGRAREAIWRNGQFHDEIQMSILEREWEAVRERVLEPRADTGGRARRRAPGRDRGHGDRARTMTTAGPEAAAARAVFRAHLEARGHAVDNARAAVASLEAALAAGTLARTPALDLMLGDLAAALRVDPDAGEKLGGKSAEAARFVLRAISRELENA